jgi:cytochrome c1
MNRKAAVAVSATVVLLAGLTTWGLLDRSSSSSEPDGPRAFVPGATPAQHAKAACDDIHVVQQLVRDNGSKDLTFTYLAAAREEMNAASSADPVWISLQSGVESIYRGLSKNEAAASELGIAIARDQCRRTGVFLDGSVGSPTASPSP